jgi:hypothetical protein
VAQVVECLPSKPEALTLSPSTEKKKVKKLCYIFGKTWEAFGFFFFFLSYKSQDNKVRYLSLNPSVRQQPLSLTTLEGRKFPQRQVKGTVTRPILVSQPGPS